MTQTIQIREFREEDLESVYRLVHKVVDICYRDVYPAGALKIYKTFHSRENILRDIHSGYCVVAENCGEIVGTGTLLEDWVRRVYVNPDYQKSGIGGMIYKALEERALEVQMPHLGLSASVIAREFWESQGFIFENEEIIPTPNDEKLTFYKMSKDLPVRSK
jgi:GNAT superfamily N-acetyltransferase